MWRNRQSWLTDIILIIDGYKVGRPVDLPDADRHIHGVVAQEAGGLVLDITEQHFNCGLRNGCNNAVSGRAVAGAFHPGTVVTLDSRGIEYSDVFIGNKGHIIALFLSNNRQIKKPPK